MSPMSRSDARKRNTNPRGRGHDMTNHHLLAAIYDLLEERLPSPDRGPVATESDASADPAPTDPPHPESAPETLTDEPPIGTQVTDRDGDVWEHVEDGWQVVDEDGPSGGSDLWPEVRAYGPLRFTTDEDRERVGIAPADDGLAEWERELFRPATCCGKCPPIAGGGYDCTCEGNPHCEKADTPEEWHADTAPADVDPDEATASDERHRWWIGEAGRKAVRAEKAEAEVERLTEERDKYATQAEKWQARHAALRADVVDYGDSFDAWSDVRADTDAILDRDDERGDRINERSTP